MMAWPQKKSNRETGLITMRMYQKINLVLLMICCVIFGQDSLKKAIVLQTTPLYDEPVGGMLPQSFIEKGDSCVIDSFFTDSSGISWFHVKKPGLLKWAQKLSVAYVTPENEDIQSVVIKDEADAKRRLRILRDHAEWPRRVKSAVRAGKVCLGMDPSQLAAAWGDPFQKGKSFILGVGECDTWFYKGNKEQILFVVLSRGNVIGWYQKE
jgi:hypothetical protein